MNYDLLIFVGSSLMAFGIMGLIWSQLKESNHSAFAFFPGLFTLGGILLALVGFIAPLLLVAH